MAQKSKDPIERKPDLNEAANQSEIEARIKEMMDVVESKPSATAIKVTLDDEDFPMSAPQLPGNKKPLSIKIIDHNERAASDIELEAISPQSSEPTEEKHDPDVMAAIEAANRQLLGEEPLGSEKAFIDETAEPAQTAPELNPFAADELVDTPALPEPEFTDDPVDEITTETADFDTAEAPELPVAPVKDKPLKHLDSIIPKNKIDQVLENDSTAKAVDDIIAKDADALMEAEDAKLAAAFEPTQKVSFGKKLLGIFKKKAVIWSVLLLLFVGAGTAAAFPNSRYLILNTAGVRSSASLVVLDESTKQPLKDVTVKLAGLEQKTDQNGRITFDGVRLGSAQLSIEKRAFATTSKKLIIGWGSNPLGEFEVSPTGSQYVFTVTDFLSGKPAAKVEAVSNEASAFSNQDGEIKLTIDQLDERPREVTITAEGYRQEKFALNLDQKEPLAIRLVPNRKHVFISKRAGKFDVYKVDVDGQNEKLVLPGTGSEREDMVLVAHPKDEVVALVSTKDNKRNRDGFLLSSLTVMNLEEESTKTVATSERVQIIDWVDSRIVYVQIKEGASGESPDRHKLISYDYKTQESKELASSNYFNDVLIASGQVYVAPSSTYSQSKGSSLIRITADGTNRQTIIDKEVWNIFRTSYDTLTVAVQQDWYQLKLGDNQAGKISGEPPSQTSRIYTDSPDKKRSLWVENRDGKGVLLAYNSDTKQDSVIRTQGGLKLPVRWLTNNTLIYRVNTESETADYALNVDGGEPVKVRDVTNTSGVDSWYFY